MDFGQRQESHHHLKMSLQRQAMFVRSTMRMNILLGKFEIVWQSHFGSIKICMRSTLWPFGHLKTI